MNHRIRRILQSAILFATTLAALPSWAQTADDLNEGLRLTIRDSATAAELAWWGRPATTYFIQNTDDLTTAWFYLPIIEKGIGAPVRYGFAIPGAAPRLFFRLVLTEQVAGDLHLADFDGDGMPNGWELEHGLNPFDPADAQAEQNGIDNITLYQQSLGSGADPSTSLAGGLIVYTP